MRAMPVLWLSGPPEVGKSAVGWAVYTRLLAAGVRAAYADIDQLGICHPEPAGDPGRHRLQARNLAAVWRTYRRAGARALVMVGPAGRRDVAGAYAAALPGSALTVCRLHAGRRDLLARILQRGRGGGSWPQPGDPLLGRPEPYLRRVAGEAAREAESLDRAGLGHRVDTGGRGVDEVTALVLQGTGWPGRVPFLR